MNILEQDIFEDYFIKDSEIASQINIKKYCKVFYEIFSGSLKKGSGLIFFIYDMNCVKIEIMKGKFGGTVFIDSVGLAIDKGFYFRDNSIYIRKDTFRKSWCKSKAADDVKKILKRIRGN